ncbi:helix-turn-helix transcriptional regulator [Cryptosporangium aurantiacum]|uniref:AAA ATPase domain-containing protein n=1 Tax=Cryptosporangium aurantiacum TaxID=134849 RepID=A0A1M7RB11_9ACTN|nr:LuxR family transcriptional regulator [Cryptosporangium aurantiacum]SHN43360.1 AAA ATPase domain-containing protein [Cryptosporangium aurantiacum]
MPPSSSSDPSADLIGRDRELDRIRRCLDVGRRGPSALLLTGAPGSGRSRLLRVAVQYALRSGPRRVLSLSGRDGLARLIRSLAPELAAQPGGGSGGQAEGARRDARGAAEAGLDGDPAVLVAALVRAARRTPLLLTADDADQYGAEAFALLDQIVRTAPAAPITTLSTAGVDGLPDWADVVPSLLLAPLSPAEAARVLDAQPVRPAGNVRAEILRSAAGSPAALVDLAAAAAAGLMAGPPAAAAGLGAGFVVGPPAARPRAELAQIDALPDLTQRLLLLAAAAAGTTEPRTLLAAAGVTEMSAWAPALRSGLVTVRASGVTFVDPLLGPAVYRAASASARRRAHRDLAAVVPDDLDRTRHLAAAAGRPDETLAAEIEAAADAGIRRGALYDAASALHRAAGRSPGPADAARRYVRAILTARDSGAREWVGELHAELARITTDPAFLGPAARAAAVSLARSGRQREAFDLLAAVFRDNPPPAAADLFALVDAAAIITGLSGLPEHTEGLRHMLATAEAAAAQDATAAQAPEPVRAAREAAAGEDASPAPGARAASAAPAPEAVQAARDAAAAGDAPRAAAARRGGRAARAARAATSSAELTRTFIRAVIDPAARAGRGLWEAPLPADLLESGESIADIHRLMMMGTTAWYEDESATAAATIGQACDRRRQSGADGAGLEGLPVLVGALTDLGRWPEAERVLAESEYLATVHDLPVTRSVVAALHAALHALRGEGADAHRVLESGWPRFSLPENLAVHTRLARARGLAAMSTGDYGAAYRHLRSLFDPHGEPLHPFHSLRAIAELATAAARADRRADALVVLEQARQACGPEPTTRMRLLLHHATALVDEDADPERSFRLATVDPAGEQWPYERAMARMHYGEWLRRRRRPLDARAVLSAARDTFDALGAVPATEQAQLELRAAGEGLDRSARPEASVLTALTPQQREIVRLAAQGLKNKEIAERLFLSPRTVGAHLYSVFPKLGITRRHELRTVLADETS